MGGTGGHLETSDRRIDERPPGLETILAGVATSVTRPDDDNGIAINNDLRIVECD